MERRKNSIRIERKEGFHEADNSKSEAKVREENRKRKNSRGRENGSKECLKVEKNIPQVVLPEGRKLHLKEEEEEEEEEKSTLEGGDGGKNYTGKRQGMKENTLWTQKNNNL